ncbi:hypothetical protein CCAE64S_01498 [Castellaniella caeni]
MSTLRHRIADTVGMLPNVFSVQTHSDYRSVISTSSAELTTRTWNRTSGQMRRAFAELQDQRAKDNLDTLIQRYTAGLGLDSKEAEDRYEKIRNRYRDIERRLQHTKHGG